MGSTFNNCKHIKSLDTNITWFSIAIDCVPIHFIACYLQPQDPSHTTETIKRLMFIIDDVLKRIPSSKFVIVGDFNENRAKVESGLKDRGFSALI